MSELLALRAVPLAPADTESELVAAVRRGDDRAFEELYARYRDRINAYVYGMVGDYARAEDIAQEVFISALRRIRRTEQTIVFKPWLYEIAKNACIDEFRRRSRAREVSLEADESQEVRVTRLLSSAPTPQAAIESKQRLADLRGAFRGLSESHHRILVLRELEGLTYNQIGARLGLTKPVVESTLFRARRRLGEEFEELESGRRCQRVQDWISTADECPPRSLGLRDRRQFSRHITDCQMCRQAAHYAGIDAASVRGGKLAVLIPGFLLVRLSGGGARVRPDRVVASRGSHATLTAVRSLHSVAPLVNAGCPAAVGTGRLATAAAVLVAGIGAGGGIMAGSGGFRPQRLTAPVQSPSRSAGAITRTGVQPPLIQSGLNMVRISVEAVASAVAIGHGFTAPIAIGSLSSGTSATASAGTPFWGPLRAGFPVPPPATLGGPLLSSPPNQLQPPGSASTPVAGGIFTATGGPSATSGGSVILPITAPSGPLDSPIMLPTGSGSGLLGSGPTSSGGIGSGLLDAGGTSSGGVGSSDPITGILEGVNGSGGSLSAGPTAGLSGAPAPSSGSSDNPVATASSSGAGAVTATASGVAGLLGAGLGGVGTTLGGVTAPDPRGVGSAPAPTASTAPDPTASAPAQPTAPDPTTSAPSPPTAPDPTTSVPATPTAVGPTSSAEAAPTAAALPDPAAVAAAVPGPPAVAAAVPGPAAVAAAVPDPPAVAAAVPGPNAVAAGVTDPTAAAASNPADSSTTGPSAAAAGGALDRSSSSVSALAGAVDASGPSASN